MAITDIRNGERAAVSGSSGRSLSLRYSYTCSADCDSEALRAPSYSLRRNRNDLRGSVCHTIQATRLEQGLEMNQQTKKDFYRGVLCSRCTQPIPLPARLARKEVRVVNEDDPNSMRDLGPRAINLRCRTCHEEGLYAESNFIDCEGTPRTSTAHASSCSP